MSEESTPPISRRRFISASGAAGAGLVLGAPGILKAATGGGSDLPPTWLAGKVCFQRLETVGVSGNGLTIKIV